MSYWDWLPLELKEYVLALAKAQHKIDLKRKRQWNCVLDEMTTYHRYKEDWGWGFIELQTFRNCTSPYCRKLRRSEQPHPHVRMFGKYTAKLKVDPRDEFDYHLGMDDQPPETTQEINASLDLLDQSPRTISRNILCTKRVVISK